MTIYMSYGSIRGEATKANRKEWIALETFKMGMENPTAQMALVGNHAGAAQRKYTGFTISRYADRATPQLMEEAANNRFADEVTIEVYRDDNDVAPVMILTFGGVVIRSIDIDCHKAAMVEIVACFFTKISIEHDPSGARFTDILDVLSS